MNRLFGPQAVAAGLRASTLLFRFALMFFLARSVSLETLGVFGLYWAGLQLACTLLTLDVYAHTTRLLLNGSNNRVVLLSLHFGFVVLAFLSIGPMVAILFYFNIQNVTFFIVVFFVIHLAFEVLASEVGRLLVPLGKPLASNLVLFLRTAVWVAPLVVGLEAGLLQPTIVTILLFWLAGSVLAVVLAFFVLFSVSGRFYPLFSLKWCQDALMSAWLFLMATLVFRGVLGLDRFLVESFLGIEVVGIYALYASVSLGVLGLIESGVSAWRFPDLLAAIQEKNVPRAFSCLRVFVKQNLIASAGLMSSVAILFPVAIWFFLDEVYRQHISAFFILVLGVFFYCASMPFHYVIYSFREDRFLLIIYSISLVIMFGLANFFLADSGVLGATSMLAASLSFIAFLRVIGGVLLMRRLKRRYAIPVNG